MMDQRALGRRKDGRECEISGIRIGTLPIFLWYSLFLSCLVYKMSNRIRKFSWNLTTNAGLMILLCFLGVWTPVVESFRVPSNGRSVSVSKKYQASHSSYFYDSTSRPGNSTGFHAALAIVPPLPEWDRLQRARHYARDTLFHTWPPAIRLFHPFTASALDVAQVVEELELEAFEITLDTWVIVPHLEAVEAAYQASQKAELWDGPSEQEQEAWEENEAVRKLIEKEERIGQEKRKARAERGAKKRQRDDDDEEEDTLNVGPSKDNPLSQYQEQQRSLLDFGGPCILCLEPNLESKLLLQDVREELAMLLNGRNDYFSASSCFSSRYIEDPIFQPSEYRPLIPVGSFESLPAAMEVARRLKGLWGEPLTFQVKELHVISSRDDDDMIGANAHVLVENPEAMYYSTTKAMSDEAWGCNAKIMLVGEELAEEDSDQDLAAQMEQLCEEGQVGGNDISNDYTILDDEEDLSDIEMWLNNDEDYDEGIKVTIGRTQFFTGDQRFFKGMPASSVVDAKDRSMGDVGAVSGLARRRRTVTRAGAVSWEEGEYGRRQTDYLPWSKREKPKKVERLLDLPASGFTNLVNMESDDEPDDENF